MIPQIGQAVNANIAHKVSMPASDKSENRVPLGGLSTLPNNGYAPAGFFPTTEGQFPSETLSQYDQSVKSKTMHKNGGDYMGVNGNSGHESTLDMMYQKYKDDSYLGNLYGEYKKSPWTAAPTGELEVYDALGRQHPHSPGLSESIVQNDVGVNGNSGRKSALDMMYQKYKDDSYLGNLYEGHEKSRQKVLSAGGSNGYEAQYLHALDPGLSGSIMQNDVSVNGNLNPAGAAGNVLNTRVQSYLGETLTPLIDNQVLIPELGSHGRLTDHQGSSAGILPQAVKEVKPQALPMSAADKAAERARLADEVRDHLAGEELDWNEITEPGREVLMDIHKTTGLKHFPKLMSELREYSYLGAADEISRKGVSGGRNRWAYNKILEEGFAQHDKVYPMSETEKMLNPRRPRTDYLYKDDMIEVPEWLR
ncbi:MAG: hypothetical protein LBU87_03715 [Lactobacillales bacterium]|nr:hypothetical protein [Lactobacillales bacterium]